MPNLHIILFEPVIPQNTGSIARLAACTGAILHLIHPLGFRTDDASVKRAGLDYWPHVDIREHRSWEEFLRTQNPQHLFFFSKFSTRPYTSASFPEDSHLVFGNETHGLPSFLHETFPDRFYKVPMRSHLVRSLNLAQCAAIVTYEALRGKEITGLS